MIPSPSLTSELANVVKKAARQTILFVDDESAICAVARLLLEPCGYRVLTADHGGAALDLFHEFADEIDLVITDLSMPWIGGGTLIRAMRARRPKTPVVVATGGDLCDLSEELEGIQLNGHIEKPFTRGSLLRVSQSVLGPSRKESA